MFDFTPTQPDVFSLEGLLAWLETQPGETEYNFSVVEDCLITRYLTAHGYDWGSYPQFTNGYTRCRVAASSPRTYAAATTRCRDAIEAK